MLQDRCRELPDHRLTIRELFWIRDSRITIRESFWLMLVVALGLRAIQQVEADRMRLEGKPRQQHAKILDRPKRLAGHGHEPKECPR